MSKIIPFLIILVCFTACGGPPAEMPSPEPLVTPTSPSGDACILPSSWSIEYNRSGGFAGFSESLEIDSNGELTVQSERPEADVREMMPDEQIEQITELLAESCPFKVESTKGVCADYFFYDLNIQMDGRTYSVQATDVTLTEGMQPLIATLNRLLQETDQ